MNKCRKAHTWSNDECPYCKIQELKKEIIELQGLSLFFEDQANYWKNQYCNMGKSSSERALERLNKIITKDSPRLKEFEKKLNKIK